MLHISAGLKVTLGLRKRDYIEDISFIKDIEKYAENEGYRMYAIVPADNQVTITVYKCEFDEEYLPYDGEVHLLPLYLFNEQN